jgi:3-dehydroquinate synthase
MKQVLNVEIKDYNIIISDDKFSKLMDDLDAFTRGQKRLFVVSKKVYKLYKQKLSLYEGEVLVLNDGEKEKNFKNYLKILETASKMGLTRSDVMIALGGGVIGDITGFAASTYMRGIDYVQIPTTLLSMVDSSVGGKTAIDMKDAKNIVGTFYQPKIVYININFLQTLDNRQFLSGLGEILKYVFIEDSCGYSQSLFLFEYLTLCCEKLFEKENMTLLRVIEYCLRLKISIVNQDEKESDLRRILNLGHTLGHALETKGKYKVFTHGEAVVQGMFFVFDWAYKQNLISYSYYRLAKELLAKYSFKQINIGKKYQPIELIELMKKDKKALQNKIRFIVPCDKKKVQEIQLSPEEIVDMF